MKVTIVAAACALALAPISAGAMTLIHAFEFAGDTSDSVGGATLATRGTSAVSGGFLDVPFNEGPEVTLPSGLTDYTIEMRFEIDSTSSWVKLIDFLDLSDDSGMYNRSGAQYFYDITGSVNPGSILPGVLHTLRLSRDSVSEEVSFSVDGGPVTAFVDSSELAVPANGGTLLNFLKDDFTTGERENSAGRIDYIRIYDDSVPPVPLPAGLPLMLTGLAGLALAGRRRSGPAAGTG